MKDKVIFFSIDRLGDYLIRSNVINIISKNYNFKEIICSEKNLNLIKTQKHFDKINLFNTNYSIYNKFIYLFKFSFKKYDSVIVFDGKNISNLLLFCIRAKFKFTFIYKKKGLINNLLFNIKKILLNKCKINFNIIYNRDLIELDNIDHYPTKYKKLKKYYENITEETYYFNEEKILEYNNNTLHDYILIHLDEKIIDIKGINDNLNSCIENLYKNTKKKIIITSFNNHYDYYKNLQFKKIDFLNLNLKSILYEEIVIIENIPLENFYYFIKNSFINISCHSGFFIHTSLLLNKKSIDIINKKDEKWLNTWTPITKNYRKVYKSSVIQVFNSLIEVINEK